MKCEFSTNSAQPDSTVPEDLPFCAWNTRRTFHCSSFCSPLLFFYYLPMRLLHIPQMKIVNIRSLEVQSKSGEDLRQETLKTFEVAAIFAIRLWEIAYWQTALQTCKYAPSVLAGSLNGK